MQRQATLLGIKPITAYTALHKQTFSAYLLQSSIHLLVQLISNLRLNKQTNHFIDAFHLLWVINPL